MRIEWDRYRVRPAEIGAYRLLAGNRVETAWKNIVAGKSGITRITRFDATGLTSQIAGEVNDFDVADYLPAKEARRVDRFIHQRDSIIRRRTRGPDLAAVALGPRVTKCSACVRPR